MESLPNVKDGVNPKAWFYLHPKVREIFEFCEIMFDKMGLDCLITSMVRPKLDDSGIHATGRALDFAVRLRPGGRRNLFVADYIKFANLVSLVFLRKSSLPSMLYHNSGLGWHYHIQTDKTSDFQDLNGVLPEEAGPTEKPVVLPGGGT